MRKALQKLSRDVAKGQRIEGKRTKTIEGPNDSFHRLRVGDHRVMYDVIPEDRAVLVLGIVDRKDLEKWLRSR